jgi:hypothetical protein
VAKSGANDAALAYRKSDTYKPFSAIDMPHMLSGLSSSDPSGKQMMGDICRQFNGRGLG